MADLLLLNATNLPWRPIFPYAFVQVSAVARRHGLTVEVVDLLDIPKDRWRSFLDAHVQRVQPRMVGLHIRQGDSVFIDDYDASPNGPQTRRDYFPIDDNRILVETLRDITRAPLIAGGFGFSTHAARLFDYLQLDYGVQGDPDDVFAHFDDVAAGRSLDSVKSLLYRDGSRIAINERGYFQPYESIEYVDPIFEKLVQFYGHKEIFGRNPPTVAVEVMRGCPFRCFFCTEPHVKGSEFRHRSLDVVEEELERLLARQVRRFWLICSELDIQGVGFGLQLAERIVRLQDKYPGPQIEWSAYALPRLTEDELRLLQRAGYAGALNDVLSLDDENLKAARVPYRSRHAVAFLKAVTKLDHEEASSLDNASSAVSKVTAGLTQRTPKELASILGLFLGNAHATPETIWKTLRRIHDEGLRESYRGGIPFPSTRVFAPDGNPICETTPRGLRTYGPSGDRPTDFIHPTFYFSDFLLERLGTPAAIMDFMRYVGDTFMSIGHRARKDWCWFLSNHITMDVFGALLVEAGMPTDLLGLRRMFSPHPLAKAVSNTTAQNAISRVLESQPSASTRVREALGLPDALDEYVVNRSLYERFDSREEIIEFVAPRTDVERLYLDWLLYSFNVVLVPAYRELLFGPHMA